MAAPHRSFLVTNGLIEEEVAHAIADWNRTLQDRGVTEYGLRTIVRGEILSMAQDMADIVWPSELRDMKAMFELLVEDGRARFPKEKFASIIEDAMGLKDAKKTRLQKAKRSVASASLVAAVALTNFSAMNNYTAEADCWAIFMFSASAFITKSGLSFSHFHGTLALAMSCLTDSLTALAQEAVDRPSLLQGDPITDKLLTETRRTHLTGYLSSLYFLRREQQIPEDDLDDHLRKFCADLSRPLYLWGESAVPFFFGKYLIVRNAGPGSKADTLLVSLLDHLIAANKHADVWPFPNVYYDVQYVFERTLGVPAPKNQEKFSGYSYAIEGIVLILARRLWKQALKVRWASICDISHDSYFPENDSEFFRWGSQVGDNHSRLFDSPTSWPSLRQESRDLTFKFIPEYAKQNKALLYLLLVVYPHRLRADVLRFLDENL